MTPLQIGSVPAVNEVQMAFASATAYAQAVVALQQPPRPVFTPVALLPEDPVTGVRPRLLYLARTNLSWFLAAVTLARAGHSFYIGGVEAQESELFTRVSKVYQLWQNNPQWEMFQFRTFSNLRAEISQGRALDWKPAADIVAAFKGETEAVVNEVRSHMVPSPANASFWLSTTHKIKGLENAYVQLADDYVREVVMQNGRVAQPDAEEWNLLYVAATRASHALFLNSRLARMMCAGSQSMLSVQAASAQLLQDAYHLAPEEAARIPLTLQSTVLPPPPPPNAPADPWAGHLFKCGNARYQRPYFRCAQGARAVVRRGSSLLCGACVQGSLFADLLKMQ